MTSELRAGLIATVIKERKRQRLTQGDLAARLGVAGTVISRFESGRHSPRLETLYDIGKALGLRLDIKIVKERAQR